LNTDGYAELQQEFDAFGNVVRECYLGVDGKPTEPTIIQMNKSYR